MKLLNRKEWEISSSNAIVEHVINNGFTNILKYNKGADGKPYLIEGGRIYALIDDSCLERFTLWSCDDFLVFTEILGGFHKAAEGFIKPAGVKIRVDWGKSIEKYRTLTFNLDKYCKMIGGRGCANEFEKRTWEQVQLLHNRANILFKVLRSTAYLKALEKSMRNKEICLNSISDRSACIGREGIMITGIYDMGYNMIEEDIGKLIKKSIERTGNKTCFKEIIKLYSQVRNQSISDNSITMIKAIGGFPYDSIKVISKYMGSKEDTGTLLNKFEKYYERELKVIGLGVQDGI